MFNTKAILAGIVLTAASSLAAVNLEHEAGASNYYIDIITPDPGTQFLIGNEVWVEADGSVGGYTMVDVTRSLQCTETSRVEDSETTSETAFGFYVESSLYGPDLSDSDVFDPFCVVVSGGGYEDRVGVSFINPCCYP